MAQEQPQPSRPRRNEFIHNASVAGAVLSPLVMLLPPRRMDVRFFVLAGTFSLCTNQLAYEYTGRSMYARVSGRLGSVLDPGLPEGAKRTQQLLREQRELDAAEKRKRAGPEEKPAGLIKDIWMGGEGEDWSKKRAEEHRKSFDEGKGMSDIILEQIADVWSGNWKGDAKKNGDDDRSSDAAGEAKK
ncbi:rhomboid family membrane protein [Drechmeria coniospora]|uniref:Rhomboid family membrane protein n=1 Tax=Drechmeria coniospora TaxID=98403 RepID=A0A151GNR6_DRECN|nr:rhomboid family membrane protein [Drechmeria coniospora]KYK58681.1 rhomboid family membrane protein [Drechmeria coniospora]ODA84045.1 hypothetical protein RJ55_02563 [Drechmeria coniospora]